MPREHCALSPEGCATRVPALECRPDYPRYQPAPWADDVVQGIAHDQEYWYLTSTQRIWKSPLHEPLARSRVSGVVPFEGRYSHLGDPDFHDGVLFVPLEGDRLGGPPAIGALRPDLSPIGIQELHGAGHAPWCAVHPQTGRLYTSDFSTDRVQVFRVEVSADHFGLIHERDLALTYTDGPDPRPLRGRVPHIQGGVLSASGKLYLSTNHRKTGIVVFDAETGAWVGQIPVTYKPSWSLLVHQEVEGLDLLDLDAGQVPAMTGQLHVLLHAELPRRRYWLKHFGVRVLEERGLL
jgi:hypothetical protein